MSLLSAQVSDLSSAGTSPRRIPFARLKRGGLHDCCLGKRRRPTSQASHRLKVPRCKSIAPKRYSTARPSKTLKPSHVATCARRDETPVNSTKKHAQVPRSPEPSWIQRAAQCEHHRLQPGCRRWTGVESRVSEHGRCR